MLAEELNKTVPDFKAAREKAKCFSRAAWETEIRRAYGLAAQEVIDRVYSDGSENIDARLSRISSIQEHWPEIRDQINTLPSSSELISVLALIGCPFLPEQIGVDTPLLRDTFLYCRETRARYTIFSLINDLGLLEKLSDNVIQRVNEQGFSMTTN